MEKTVKKRKGTGGFTLVELIVVIAILAILAGVGTVAYTGYITATRRGVDRTLVGDLIYAAQLADYANPGLLDDNMGIIVVTDSGATASGSNQGYTAFTSAIEDSMGNLSNVSLSYDSWGSKVADVNDMLDTISTGSTDKLGDYLGQTDQNGESVMVGYADVANDYWNVVETLARSAGSSGSFGGFTEEMGGQLTLLTAYATARYSDGKKMGDAWASNGAPSNSALKERDETVVEATEAGYQISLQGANLARNMAFAQYLSKYGNYEGVEEDVASLLDTSTINTTDRLTNGTAPASGKDSEYSAVVNNYLSTEVFNGKSQAYIDGLAYYTFMDSLDKTYGDYERNDNGVITGVNISDNFWDETDNHISWAAAVGSGKISVTDMSDALNGAATEDNVVIVMVDRTKGYLKCTVFPVDADPRDGDEDIVEVETPTETVTVSITVDDITISPAEIKTTFGAYLVADISAPAGWTIKSATYDNNNSEVFTTRTSKNREGILLITEQRVPTATGTHGTTGIATLTVTIADSAGTPKTLSTTVSLKALD